MIRGKRREMGLGSPPIVSLAEAREAALDNKRSARNGGDPLAEKRKAKAILTFEEAARCAHIELTPTWKNPKDAAAFLSTLETYAFPRFGKVLLPDVTTQDVRQVILKTRDVVPGVARKLTYRISAVFKWGIAENICESNPALPQALALPKQAPSTKHRKALPYTKVRTCLDAVLSSGAGHNTKMAMEFLILTASRSGEVRNAEWSEIDLDAAIWSIPAKKMKANRDHRVPLSPRAIEILKLARDRSKTGTLVFEGNRLGTPLSDMTLSKLVKDLGFDADVHGFRTSFRTWTQEQTDYPREVAEAALAHSIRNRSEAAYARSDLFEKRRTMMNAWSYFLA